MPRLHQGDSAPALILPAADGSTVSISDLRGSGVVVFFYPAAGTPACAAESCEFQDALGPLLAAGYRVIGVSPDSVEKLAAVAAADSLEYPLLSDPDHSTIERWGAWGAKVLYGREVISVIRSTVVLAPDGIVQHALYNVRAKGHVARVRKLLGV